MEEDMKYDSTTSEKATALSVAHQMVTAARTAPKGCGVDKIVAMVLDGDDKKALSDEMRKLAELPGLDFCIRDANNVDDSHCVVLIGVQNIPLGLDSCGMCGFGDCVNSVKSGSLCAFNTTDMGIAIGSAVSIAADHRIDNRVMFSIGKAALALGLLGIDVTICFGIPLSTHTKSNFFDRESAPVISA
jgi:uncharacterized ferredoxin-like protein